MVKKRVGVVLAGCGFLDGAEIQEAVLTLLYLDQRDAEIICMAPNIDQMHVVDHNAGEPAESETRNVLVESARIARCEVRDVADVSADELDALVFPGGFGAAKNLCSFAVDGPDCSVNPNVEGLIRSVHGQGKPLGFICIAPALAAKVLGELGPKLTIGNDPGTAAAIEALGATHVDCSVDECVVDERLRIASTPAYMLGPSVAHIAKGIDKCVGQVLAWA
jgi:enhancing lycopene biosynthesis protein 2